LVGVLKSAHDYYTVLQQDYPTRIRQLVPKYDELVGCVAALLREREPGTILDIGAGVGEMTAQVLDALPRTRLTALDASPAMAAQARSRLQAYGDRVTVVQTGVLQYAPARPFEAVFSNLVLHNVPFPEKRELLHTIREWLTEGGVFVWGDLVRHSDPQLQQRFVNERREFAIARGCPEDLVAWNFRKEAREDYPFTADKAASALERAGFASVDLVWAHDTFAVFLACAS
jgi:ubiquinone/menaquinone biosynthesis C-methylase UbiE